MANKKTSFDVLLEMSESLGRQEQKQYEIDEKVDKLDKKLDTITECFNEQENTISKHETHITYLKAAAIGIGGAITSIIIFLCQLFTNHVNPR